MAAVPSACGLPSDAIASTGGVGFGIGSSVGGNDGAGDGATGAVIGESDFVFVLIKETGRNQSDSDPVALSIPNSLTGRLALA